MGYLLDATSPSLVDGQRDVVKNERRQSYENRPYGMADIALDESLWPADHPYHWPTIGHMEDLTAASYQDVVDFFKVYYAPNNASLVLAGDIDLDATQALVEKWFSEIPRGAEVAPVAPPAAQLTQVKRVMLTDRVRLPRLYLAWLTPRHFAPGDATLDVLASVLASGKNSRLYKRLVYDTQIAQDVTAYQASGALGSSFQIIATARPGHTAADLELAIDEEIERLKSEAPAPREVERALNQIEASFYRGMESVGGFGGKADQLNAYFAAGGGPDFFGEDLARYETLTAADVQSAAIEWLPDDRRVELVVEPEAAP
jgi:zinc protease